MTRPAVAIPEPPSPRSAICFLAMCPQITAAIDTRNGMKKLVSRPAIPATIDTTASVLLAGAG